MGSIDSLAVEEVVAYLKDALVLYDRARHGVEAIFVTDDSVSPGADPDQVDDDSQ